MANLCVLRHLKVLQYGTTGNNTALEMVNTKAFEVLHAEMFQQFLLGGLFGEYPVVELESEELTAEELFKLLLTVALKEHFLGREITE